MIEVQGFLKIKDIVQEYIFQSQDHHNDFARLLVFAINGMKEIDWDCSQQIKSVELPVVDGVLTYPDDMIAPVQFSICFGGVKTSLGMNPQMCSPGQNSCGETIAVVGGGLIPENLIPFNTAELTPISVQIWGTYNTINGGLFGYGGGYSTIGYYNDEKRERRFTFSSGFKYSSVILDYIPTSYNPDDQTEHVIHTFFKSAVKNFIAWQKVEFIPGKEREADRLKQAFYSEKIRGVRRLKPLNLRHLIDAVRNAYMQAPKGA